MATTSRQKKTGGEGAPPELPPEPVGKPTNLFQRVQRARSIAADRARVPRRTWPYIAKKYGLAESTVKEIYADYLSWDIEVEDTLGAVDEAISLYTVMLEQLGEEAANGDHSAARVGAVRAMTDIIRERFEMLQAAGRVPRNLARYRAETEFATIVREMLEAMERRGVERDVLEELKALAARHLDAPIGDNVTSIHARQAAT